MIRVALIKFIMITFGLNFAHGYTCKYHLSSTKPQSYMGKVIRPFSVLNLPIRERGSFVISEEEVVRYYTEYGLTSGFFSFESSFLDQMYKIDSDGDFQVQSWQSRYDSIFELQQRFSFNIDVFNEAYEETDLVSAKKKQYGDMIYSSETYVYSQKPYHFMAEWGGLSHPPLTRLAYEDVPKVNTRFSDGGVSETFQETSIFNTPEFHKQLDAKSNSELSVGNEYELLLDQDSYKRKMEIIGSARKSIFVSSLVFVDEKSVSDLADLLIRKHNQGIEVKVLVEGAGTGLHGSIAKRLRRAGVSVVFANDFLNYKSAVVYHTKIVAVDFETVIMGGQNMLDADLASRGTDFKNRDADILIKGPGALDSVINFVNDWNHFTTKWNPFSSNRIYGPFSPQRIKDLEGLKEEQREKGVRGERHYETWFNDPLNLPAGMGRFVAQSPYHSTDTLTDAHLMFIEALRSYFVLTTPHIFDTYTENGERGFRLFHKTYDNFNKLFKGIKNKLDQNPDLFMDLLTTGVGFAVNEATPMTEARMQRLQEEGKAFQSNLNQLWLDATNRRLYRSTYELLLKDWHPHENASVWTHNSYLHSKIWLFDRMVASIGSFNLHQNATDHSYEASYFIHDLDFIREVERELALDLANSVPFIPDAGRSN